MASLGKRPLLSRSGVLCYFENGGKQKRGANLSTNRRVSQCSLICLVAANEIIATGPATVISSGCLLSPKLSRSPSLLAGYPREEERRRAERGRKDRKNGETSRRNRKENCGETCFADIFLSTSRRWRETTADIATLDHRHLVRTREIALWCRPRGKSVMVGRCKWNSLRKRWGTNSWSNFYHMESRGL